MSTTLTILFRVEPGCLGPEGQDHIENFCRFASEAFNQTETAWLQWQITPRYDKSLPELQYKIGRKLLSQSQAAQYLQQLIKGDLERFEDAIQNRLTQLTFEFQQRHYS
ncbi:hypothetical protein D5085_09310 [Ectothiorhodospiraceae bacterium BW-2]|nr:hypothetical protein D5085_09310 [Ectothiorhodospiraceae bacterium BW-2]